MLGAINGNHINLSALNSEGALVIVLADAVFTQANATSASAGVTATAATATMTEAAYTLSAAGTVPVGAALSALLANQAGAGAGALAISGAVDTQIPDDTLAAAFKQILVPHGRGSSVTMH